LRSTAVVSQMTLLSRVLGFVRDVVIARSFGASMAADAFFVAFKIPNLFRRLFAEGAFSQAFVPVLAENRSRGGDAAVRGLVDAVGGSLAIILLAVVATGVLAAPLLIWVFAPGFSAETSKSELAAALLRVTFPYLLFVSLSGLAGAVANVYGRFALPAFSPVMLNLALIAGALWLAPYCAQPVFGLAIGVLLGGLCQLGLQYAALTRLGFRVRPRVAFRDQEVKKILRLMGPALFGSSVPLFNMMLDTILASFLVTGSVSWLYYADRLYEFPLGVFGAALATVILPTLAARHAAGDATDYARTLDWALRWTVLVATPAMLALVVLAVPLLSALFEYGRMSAHDVEMSARALVAYALGLLPFVAIKVFASAFYARQDTATPVRIGIIAMLANSVLNLILIFPFAHAGLALATTLAAYLNAGMLFFALRRTGGYTAIAIRDGLVLRVVVACVAMSLVLCWLALPVARWHAWTVGERAWQLSVMVGAGVLIYFAVLAACGWRPRHMALGERNV